MADLELEKVLILRQCLHVDTVTFKALNLMLTLLTHCISKQSCYPCKTMNCKFQM